MLQFHGHYIQSQVHLLATITKDVSTNQLTKVSQQLKPNVLHLQLNHHALEILQFKTTVSANVTLQEISAQYVT